VRLDEGEFSVFLLTNPRQRLDTGRRLAGVETRLQKSQNNGKFSLVPASIWRLSDKEQLELAWRGDTLATRRRTGRRSSRRWERLPQCNRPRYAEHEADGATLPILVRGNGGN
jgi:hypothetical protein